MTQQRRIILDELRKTCRHPSASEIYERVRKRMPHISLGTVYRNLEVLSFRGVIRKLNMPTGQKRFDAGRDDHQHVRCISCGRVDDLPTQADENLEALANRVEDASGYRHLEFAVDFYGICPGCARERKNERQE